MIPGITRPSLIPQNTLGSAPANYLHERGDSSRIATEERNTPLLASTPPRSRHTNKGRGSPSSSPRPIPAVVENSLKSQGANELAQILFSKIDEVGGTLDKRSLSTILNQFQDSLKIDDHHGDSGQTIPRRNRQETISCGSAFSDALDRFNHHLQNRPHTPDQLDPIEGEHGKFLTSGGQAKIFLGSEEHDSVVKVFHTSDNFNTERRNSLKVSGVPHVLSPMAEDMDKKSLEIPKMKGDLMKFVSEVHRELQKPEKALSVIDAHMVFKKIMSDCASGLGLMHMQKKIVHLDIKPNNILLDYNGRAYLADLGISKQIGEPVGGKGTFGYAPPEVWQKNDLPSNEKLDSYAFGQTLFYLYTGNTVTPNAGNEKSFLLRYNPATYTYTPNHIREQFQQRILPPFKSEEFASERVKIENLIVRLMSTNPAERPSMAEILANDYCKDIKKKFEMINKIWDNSAPMTQQQISTSETNLYDCSESRQT